MANSGPELSTINARPASFHLWLVLLNNNLWPFVVVEHYALMTSIKCLAEIEDFEKARYAATRLHFSLLSPAV